MFVQAIQDDAITGAIAFKAGQIMQIPREFYNPASMMRLGCPPSGEPPAGCILWATVSPDWPYPINAE